MTCYLWKNSKLAFALNSIFTAIAAAYLVFMSRLMGGLVDRLMTGDGVRIGSVALEFMLIVVAGIAILLSHFFFTYIHEARRKLNMERDLAGKLICKVRSQSDVTNIYNQEIELVGKQYLQGFFSLLSISVSFLYAVVVGLFISWEIVAGVFLLSSLTMLASQLFGKKLTANAKSHQDSNAEMNKTVSGIFASIRTINIFSAQNRVLALLNDAFAEKQRTFLQMRFFETYATQTNNFFGWVTQFGLIVASFVFVSVGRMSVGNLTVMLLLMQYLCSPMFNMIGVKNQMTATRAVRNKLKAILGEPTEQIGQLPPPSIITFCDVSFSYTEKVTFMDGINLKFEHGKRYLIVGPSGCGKSSLLKLLLKELTPTGGVITYNGADASDINTPTWHKNIAYTGQNIEVLPGTLRENVILDRVYDGARFREVINMLNLSYLADKFDVPLSEDIGNFSGGELQRVAIARMLYDNSPIFVFDEFSSALDYENAHLIEEELLRIDDKLLISVTHRIHRDLLSRYDAVIIMEDGKVVHTGSPEDMADSLLPFIAGANT